LVNSQTPKWQASGVEWTKEGAKFDGTSSKMTLKNVNFGDFSLGFTWLLRLKRQPSSHRYFMTNFDCLSTELGSHFIEYPDASRLYFGTCNQFQPTRKVFSTNRIMPNDSSEFTNIAIVGRPWLNSYSLFLNSSFIIDTITSDNDHFSHRDSYECFNLGYRSDRHPNVVLTGIVRAVGITNQTLALEEINKFFQTVQ
jgi:hypothetical protein